MEAENDSVYKIYRSKRWMIYWDGNINVLLILKDGNMHNPTHNPTAEMIVTKPHDRLTDL